jgi:hypothetical protein
VVHVAVGVPEPNGNCDTKVIGGFLMIDKLRIRPNYAKEGTI